MRLAEAAGCRAKERMRDGREAWWTRQARRAGAELDVAVRAVCWTVVDGVRGRGLCVCAVAVPRREREAGASCVGRCAVRGPAPLRVVTD